MADLSNFKKISIVGDIHGDYTIFKDIILQHINNFTKDSCLVFCGDYIDRGSDSDKICQFLFNLFENKNGKEYEEFIDMTNKNISYEELYRTIFFIGGNHELTRVSGFDDGYNNISREEIINKFDKYLNEKQFYFIPYCVIRWDNCSTILISHASIKNLKIFTTYNIVWGTDKDLINDDKYKKLKTLVEQEKQIINIHGHDHKYDKGIFTKDFNIFDDCDVSLDNSDNNNENFIKLTLENNTNEIKVLVNKYNYLSNRLGYFRTNEYNKTFKWSNRLKNNKKILIIISAVIIVILIITMAVIVKRRIKRLKRIIHPPINEKNLQ